MKLLHTADIHLDTPFSMADPEQADRMRNELRAAFASLTLYARTQKMDLCLIAGDLFNNSFATRDTLAFLRREFESAPECRFVISPGNHDYYGEFSAYARAEFPQNVFVFTKPGLSCFSFDEIGTNVWGFAFCDRQYRARVLSGFSLPTTKNMNLFLGHCDLTQGASIYAPLSREEIAQSGFDYAALGHIHNSAGISRIGNTYYGYSGCLQGRGFDETGYKGALVAQMEKQEGILRFSAKRVRFARHHFEKETLDITGAKTQSELGLRIKALLREKKYDADTALSLTLCGTAEPDFCPNEEYIAKELPPLLRFELHDGTHLGKETGELRNDPTIRGAFFESLREYLQSEDEATRALGEAALRLGLDALENTQGR